MAVTAPRCALLCRRLMSSVANGWATQPSFNRWLWFVSAFGRSEGIARAGRLTIFDMAGVDALVATYVHVNHVGVFLTCWRRVPKSAVSRLPNYRPSFSTTPSSLVPLATSKSLGFSLRWFGSGSSRCRTTSGLPGGAGIVVLEGTHDDWHLRRREG